MFHVLLALESYCKEQLKTAGNKEYYWQLRRVVKELVDLKRFW